VQAHLAVGIDDAQIHPVDVQVDAAVKLVLNRVESHRVSSWLRGMRIHLQDTECASVGQKEEAFISIKRFQRTGGTAGGSHVLGTRWSLRQVPPPAAEPWALGVKTVQCALPTHSQHSDRPKADVECACDHVSPRHRRRQVSIK
jgi:hypothetical protein